MTGTKHYQTDDWVLHDYKVKQITSMEYGKIRNVSDGSFSHGSLDLTPWVRPLTLRNLCFATNFDYHYCAIKEVEKGANLNWPDIHNKLVALWLEEIDASNEIELDTAMINTRKWVNDFVRSVRDSVNKSCGGVQMFRH